MAFIAPDQGYLTPDEFVLRYDARRIKSLASDTGAPITDVNASATLTSILEDASQQIWLACRVGKRYKKADLDSIYNGPTAAHPEVDPYAKRQLQRLVADIAYGLLVSRRGLALDEVFAQAPLYKQALETLEALKQGLRIFDDLGDDPSAQADAGVRVSLVQPTCGPWSARADRLFGGVSCGCRCP